MSNPDVTRLVRDLRRIGYIADLDGAGHYKFTFDGERVKASLSLTPSDGRWKQNFLAGLKREGAPIPDNHRKHTKKKEKPVSTQHKPAPRGPMTQRVADSIAVQVPALAVQDIADSVKAKLSTGGTITPEQAVRALQTGSERPRERVGLTTMQFGAALTLILTDKHSGRQVRFGPEVMYDVLVDAQYDNGGNFMRDAEVSGYTIEATADFLGAFQRTEPMRELQERPQIGGPHE